MRGCGNFHGLHKIGLGLARKPDDHIGGHRQVRDGASRFSETIQIALSGVTAMHRCQHGVAAGLHRVMQVFAHAGGFGHGQQGVFAHVFGVRAHVSHPLHARHCTNGPQQGGKLRHDAHRLVACATASQRQVATIRVDVLSEQEDLGNAVGGQPAHFVDDALERPADFAPAHGRNDAIGTRVVAADLNRHPTAIRRFASHWQRRRKQRVVINDCFVQNLGHCPTDPRLVEQLGGPVHIVGTKHHVYPRCALPHQFAVFLRQTASHHNLATGVGVFPGLHRAERAIQLFVGIFSNATRINDHHVGFGFVVNRLEAVLF